MKVRIKEWWELEREFGLDEDGDINCYCSFTTEMKEYCGKVIELNENDFCVDTGTDKVFLYNGWFFNNETYEIIEE